jgi:hypothetical protein
VEDRYTGDAGDFGKFGLLRALVKEDASLNLGLIWYLYPDEEGNADGKHVRYLCQSESNDRRFRACDSELYEALRELIKRGERRVGLVPGLGILPTSTVYFEELLDFPGMPSERPAAREAWLARALSAIDKCDIVLLDPDNGIQCSVTRRERRAGKYVYFDEIARMLERDKTVVLYQHFDHTEPAPEQIKTRAHRLAEHLGLQHLPTALLYHRGNLRSYFFLTQPRHEDVVHRAIGALTSSPWSQHFTLAI